MSVINNSENYISHLILPLNKIEIYISKSFQYKYKLNNIYYLSSIINNIIYNEKTHLVAKFKDYLIIDDMSEFLKRYYGLKESLIRLPHYFEYYENFNKIFPNYTALKESKYIYKNIHKKQKMIDQQLELEVLGEPSNEQIIYQNEKSEIEDIIKWNESNHQRKKNKQDIIFNNSIYNSIIKQSEDLYSFIFGIDKKNEDNDSSISDINEITNLIDRCSKMKFNCNKNVGISKINNINIEKKHMKTYNNSSLLTKQSTINSSRHNKYRKNDNVYPNNNDLIMELKKSNNNKYKSVTSSLIFSSNTKKYNKNEIINNRKKSIFLTKLIQKIQHSGKKTERKHKHIKININYQNSINCIKEIIKSKYSTQKEKNDKFLREKRINHCKYNTLNTESNKNHYINSFINRNNCSNHKDVNMNKSSFSNKKSNGKNYKTAKTSKNPSMQKHKKANTIISESARKPLKKNLCDSLKEKTIKGINKMAINLKEIKKLMKEKKNKKNSCHIQKSSISNSRRIDKNKKSTNNSNSKNNDNITKFSLYKTLNTSVDKKPKINKPILFSKKMLLKIKKGKQLPYNLSEQKKYRKINKNKIIQMCKEIKDFSSNNNSNNTMEFKTENNSINLSNSKRQNHEFNDINKSTKYYISNNFSSIKNNKMKNHNVILNFGPAKNRIIINIKNNFIIGKVNSATSRNIEFK